MGEQQFGEQYAGWMAYDAEDGTEHVVWCQYASSGIMTSEDQDLVERIARAIRPPELRGAPDDEDREMAERLLAGPLSDPVFVASLPGAIVKLDESDKREEAPRL
jgi:hypothetical protein